MVQIDFKRIDGEKETLKEYILLKKWTKDWKLLIKEDEVNEKLDKETREYALKNYDVVCENFKELYDDYKCKLYAFSNKKILAF